MNQLNSNLLKSNLILFLLLGASASLSACMNPDYSSDHIVESTCPSADSEYVSCDDMSGANTSEDRDRVRFQIEVIGDGAVILESPVKAVCTSEQGICHYDFEPGSLVVLDWEGELWPSNEAEDSVCEDNRFCSFQIDSDTLVIANTVMKGDTLDFRPEEPGVIVDDFQQNSHQLRRDRLNTTLAN